jgi:hypothetical protein
MATASKSLSRKITLLRKHLDKVLVALSGVAILASGYLTYDYKSSVDCQVQLLDADRQFTTTFTNAMVILLAQPPHPVEERRLAFEQVRIALVEKQRIQQELGNCQ